MSIQYLLSGADTRLAHGVASDRGQTRAAALTVKWASCWREVREAQRLRYRVLAEELGARVPTRLHQLHADEFDAYCDHLLVRDGADGAVIGPLWPTT